MGTGRNEKSKAKSRIGSSVALGLAVVLTAGLFTVADWAGSRAFATDLLGPEGEAQPLPPPPPVPVRPLPPPLVVAQPRCLIVPQPQNDISGQDVIRFRPTWVCFSRGLLADRLPPPPPPVRPWWRLYW
jgi:hypothetical protein